MKRLPLLLLALGLPTLAAPPPTASLKGQRVSVPLIAVPALKPASPNLLVSARKEELMATLNFRGWVPGPIAGELRVEGKLPELVLETNGTALEERFTLRLWQRPEVPEQDPLWLGLVTRDADVKPLESRAPSAEPSQTALQRVLADFSYGVSQTRQASRSTGAKIAWVELHFAPEEAEHLPPPPADGAPPGTSPSRVVLLPLPPVEQVSDEVITRVANPGKRVALTFDACSTLDRSQYDQQVIAVLRKEKVPATLFVSGRWAETHTKEIQALAQDPLFEIANHSYIHPHMTEMPPARRKDELLWTQEILYSLTGKVPRFFRPPYGEYNPEVLQEAARLGLRTVEYDLPSGDPDKKVTAEKLTEWVARKAMPGSVVVMHMNRHGWRTAESLPGIIKALRGRGLVLSRVSDMVDAGASHPVSTTPLP